MKLLAYNGNIIARWRHGMETFSSLPTLCEGNPLVTGKILSQKPVTRSFDVFLDQRLNKQLSKQSRSRWFATPSRSLWRHCNGIVNLPIKPHYEISIVLRGAGSSWPLTNTFRTRLEIDDEKKFVFLYFSELVVTNYKLYTCYPRCNANLKRLDSIATGL